MRNDFTYLAILVGFFILMLGLVWACDRIVGTDEEAGDFGAEELGTGDHEQVTA